MCFTLPCCVGCLASPSPTNEGSSNLPSCLAECHPWAVIVVEVVRCLGKVFQWQAVQLSAVLVGQAQADKPHLRAGVSPGWGGVVRGEPGSPLGSPLSCCFCSGWLPSLFLFKYYPFYNSALISWINYLYIPLVARQIYAKSRKKELSYRSAAVNKRRGSSYFWSSQPFVTVNSTYLSHFHFVYLLWTYVHEKSPLKFDSNDVFVVQSSSVWLFVRVACCFDFSRFTVENSASLQHTDLNINRSFWNISVM